MPAPRIDIAFFSTAAGRDLLHSKDTVAFVRLVPMSRLTRALAHPTVPALKPILSVVGGVDAPAWNARYSLAGLAGRDEDLLIHRCWPGVRPFVLIAALAQTSSLAWATATDPAWLPGTYDGADGDDLIYLVTSTPAQRQPAPPKVTRRTLVAAGIVAVPADPGLRRSTPSESHLRSPPSI